MNDQKIPDALIESRLNAGLGIATINDIYSGSAYFGWGITGVGFGQLSFHVDQKTQVITCMNECMSRDSVRKILIAFANHIADNAIMDDA